MQTVHNENYSLMHKLEIPFFVLYSYSNKNSQNNTKFLFVTELSSVFAVTFNHCH